MSDLMRQLTFRPCGTSGCKRLDPGGQVLAWMVDVSCAATIVKLMVIAGRMGWLTPPALPRTLGGCKRLGPGGQVLAWLVDVSCAATIVKLPAVAAGMRWLTPPALPLVLQGLAGDAAAYIPCKAKPAEPQALTGIGNAWEVGARGLAPASHLSAATLFPNLSYYENYMNLIEVYCLRF
jgi:hypothetical protein